MTTEPTSSPRRGQAIAAVVLGGISLVAALLTIALFAVPGYGMALLVTTPLGAGLAAIIGVIGLIVAIAALRSPATKVPAVIGLAASALGIVVAIVAVIAVFGGFHTI
jgi:hypothetical protein